ncbi:MAG: PilZ domain-containing protein [Candidatus Omnitrophica bacterium]|jgi:hypothetical protein|nr:PilZ domain-containing protein [Candidatus Omnitrophota bacterium]MDD5070361.1 PilZ domain-containing protein [Candidatus Omnitrophota bacterium]
MECCYCLLDANSLIKYYVDLSGSAVIRCLLDRSPSKIIYLSTIQAEEIIGNFYKFRRQGIIDSDDKLEAIKDTFFKDIGKKFYLYDFVREHLIDFSVPIKITQVPPPPKKPAVYIRWFGSLLPISKRVANTADAIMLKIIREIHLLSGGNCCLVTSDEHVKMVAAALEPPLVVIDCEKNGIENFPKKLDPRCSKERQDIKLKVVCCDSDSSAQLETMSTINLSQNGVCLETRKPVETGRLLKMKLSTFNGNAILENIEGLVVWYNPTLSRLGIEFCTGINPALFFPCNN